MLLLLELVNLEPIGSRRRGKTTKGSTYSVSLLKDCTEGQAAAPVHRLAVLAFLQQVLAALEVRALVEDPPASLDPAGVNLPPVELLQNGVTVLRRFEHLTGKVRLDVEVDLVGVSLERGGVGGWGYKVKWSGVFNGG